jgi:hypothetical protein
MLADQGILCADDGYSLVCFTDGESATAAKVAFPPLCSGKADSEEGQSDKDAKIGIGI